LFTISAKTYLNLCSVKTKFIFKIQYNSLAKAQSIHNAVLKSCYIEKDVFLFFQRGFQLSFYTSKRHPFTKHLQIFICLPFYSFTLFHTDVVSYRMLPYLVQSLTPFIITVPIFLTKKKAGSILHNGKPVVPKFEQLILQRIRNSINILLHYIKLLHYYPIL
jgi:hypothetical protein